jgi:hypothetical protein
MAHLFFGVSMRWLLAVLMCGFICSTAFAMDQAEAKKIYEADTQKVRAGDLQFDWREYRLAAVTYGPGGGFDWHPVRNRFMQEMNSGDLPAALKSANEIINHNTVEPEGHLLAMIALQKSGRDKDAAFEYKVVDAYVQSILASGDGKSSKTAFFVVDESEEYFYLNVVLGVGLPMSQSLVNQDGHSFDMLKVKDASGKEQEIWFNVDTSMNAMKDAIEAGSKKKK